MWFQSLLDALCTHTQPRYSRPRRRTADLHQMRRMFLEGLEDRRLLAFDLAVNYPVGTNPQAVVAADFNNDTILDLAVANTSSSDVSVLLGNADGTFQPAVAYGTGAYPLSLAVGDFDDDGNLDIATANYYDVSVLPGNGLGSFGAASSLGVVGNPQSVAVGDFNGDGLLDLGVTSNVYSPGSYTYYPGYGYYWSPGYYSGYANVLLGNADATGKADGTFSAPNSTYLDYGSHKAALAADLNGDIYDDFVTINVDFGYVSVLLGDSSGFLQGPTGFYAGYYPISVATGDVDADGDTDLVAANYYGNNVSVLLGDGLGGFGAAQTYAIGSYPSSVTIGDFNHDTKPDIATANYSNDLSVLYGRAGGTFSPAVNVASGLDAYALAAGDFNGDTWLDAAALTTGGNVSVLLNNQNWPPPPATLSMGDVTVTEGNSGTTLTEFVVTRSDTLAGTVTVNFSTASGGGAVAGSDYVANSGTLTFAPNETSKTITILVNGDVTDEFDEVFYVNLSNPDGAIIVDNQGEGTIVDNDPPPEISINDVTMNERGSRQNTSFVFTVSLSDVSGKWVYVNFATADGTATLEGGDYVARSGTISIAPGTRTATLTVTIRGDKGREPTETFVVNLSSPTDGTIKDGQGVGTIVNDDGGKGAGKGKPNRDVSADLIAALLAEDNSTTTPKRK